MIPVVANSGDAGYCLTASAQHSLDAETETETETLIAVAHALRGEGFDASEDGTGRGTPIVPVAGAICRDSFAGGPGGRPEGAAANHFLPVAFDCKGTQVQALTDGSHPTLRSMNHSTSHQNAGGHAAVATATAVRRLTVRECERLQGFPDDFTLIPWRARRKIEASELLYLRMTRPELSMDEARRLASDGPRYKALGNSWAVNCAEWIGERIQIMEDMTA